MPVVTQHFIGRAGNQMVQYLAARSYAAKYGYDYQCEPWIGQRIFDLHDDPIVVHNRPRRSELDLVEGEADFDWYGYSQNQRVINYTRTQAREWLKFRPEIIARMSGHEPHPEHILAHRRVGDFAGYGYPLISEKSYVNACEEHGLDKTALRFVTEEKPYCPILMTERFTNDLSFVPDFYRMVHAYTLLRGNSTFSFVAGLLGHGKIFSPVIDGLIGGIEHDNVRFIPGNASKLSNHDFCTQMHVKE